MSTPLRDTRSRTTTQFADYLPTFVSSAGLASLTVGAMLVEGWFPVGVVLVTALLWWRTTTPLALTGLTIGLAIVLPPALPIIQFGGSMGTLSSFGVPIVAFAGGMGLLTVGDWLASRTIPPLAGGWMLVPLGVGWLCVSAAVVADISLWLVVASCGGLTILSANAITQLTDYRLTTTDEAIALNKDQ